MKVAIIHYWLVGMRGGEKVIEALCEMYPQADIYTHVYVPEMVSETIRYQTPLAHMSRVATRDVELGGKTIKAGERVVMWYISGNRDETQIENPNAYIIDRERPRQHMSFGFGIHRCVGNRVAEMQLTIIWEEILKRFPVIQMIGEPVRSYSAFVHGFESMQVIIPART